MTRKILDFRSGIHLIVTYTDNANDPNPYRVHLIWFDPERLSHRRKTLAKYADLPSTLHYVTWYLTNE